MNGGSLGLRSSSSYGLLQSNNSPFAFLSVSSVPGSTGPNGRKFNSKVLLAGSREKERRLSSVCKIVSRRKMGCFCLLLLSFFFTLSRGFVSVLFFPFTFYLDLSVECCHPHQNTILPKLQMTTRCRPFAIGILLSSLTKKSLSLLFGSGFVLIY